MKKRQRQADYGYRHRSHSRDARRQLPAAGDQLSQGILTNCRRYPRDEAPAAYKDFDEVLRSVTAAGLASEPDWPAKWPG